MPIYSYSRIGCYFTCPRQYKFKYIEKPPIEKITGVEAFMGTTVHDTLEQCYNLVRAGKSPDVEQLVAIYNNLWRETLPDNLHIVKKDMTADDYKAIGETALRRYHCRYYPFDSDITLGLERRVSFSLDDEGKYKLQGFIDRLSRDDSGLIRIQDYKTSGNLPTQPEIDAEAQLALYQIGVEEMWPDNNGIELVWHFLQFDMPLISRRTPKQLDMLREEYIDKIRRIEKATELNNFPTNETALCNWCEYFSICPAKGGAGSPVPAQKELPLLSDEQRQAMIDEYIELDGRKKEIETKLAEIKETIIALAGSESSTLFEGASRGAVQVTKTSVEKLPTRSVSPVAFAKIEKAVREAGVFEEYSSLDIRGLQTAFSEQSLPDALLDQLRELAELTIQSAVRIKKNKKGASGAL